jgi:hypothetical protein
MEDRYLKAAEDKEKYTQMVTTFSTAETPQDLSKLELLYIFDMSYPRGDISLASKRVKIDKGWPRS